MLASVLTGNHRNVDGQFVALNAGDGKLLWEMNLGPSRPSANNMFDAVVSTPHSVDGAQA